MERRLQSRQIDVARIITRNPVRYSEQRTSDDVASLVNSGLTMRAACVFYTLALVFGALSTTQAQSSCNAPVATATASDILTIMQSMQKQLKSMSAEISTLKTNATTCVAEG